jgi:biofilm PGA synthesis N-glycosyltransferase PgaC
LTIRILRPVGDETIERGALAERAVVVVVSPARNEEATLERTLASMRAQTRPPDLWVIVDDGSTDRTAEIAARAASETAWIRVVPRSDRGFREVGGGVVEAFYAGLDSVDQPYDFVAKMDVDLEFSPRYIERLLERFGEDPQLAAASGKVFRRENGGLVEESIIDEQVSGAFKFYRREAFERIGGFVRAVMWDGIDFHRARMEGYRTRSFRDEDLRIIHLRLMGSTDRSVYRGRLRWGAGQWFMGSAFPYVIASGLFRMRERPYVVGGLLIVAGYLLAALRGEPRYQDDAFRRELHRWQRARLGLLARGQRPT